MSGLDATVIRYRDWRDLHGRGLIGLPVLDSTAAACEAAAALAERLPDAKVVLVYEDRPSDEQITRLNRDRDTLLCSGRSVLLVVGSGDDARFARRTAPDLTAVLDLSAEITGTRRLSWTEVEARLRELHLRTLTAIDRSGLVASTARDTRHRGETPPLYQLGDLPEWLTLAGLDPMPLLRRWVRSEEALLRAVVWYPWLCEGDAGTPRLDRRKQWAAADPVGLSSVDFDSGWSFPAPPVDRTPALRVRFPVS